jgi:predicted nucleic acid-binding protein
LPSVYIETSIVSHATARSSNDPVVQVLQTQARLWWDTQRGDFDLYTSQTVLDEAALGDASAAADRLRLLQDLDLVPVNDEVRRIAGELLARSLMPQKAAVDALHVAAAAVSGVDYLLTQNCRHIANAHVMPRVYAMLEELGVPRPLICTPAEFLEDSDDDEESNT